MKITKGQLNESIRRLLAGGNIPTDHPVHAVDIDVLITTVGLDMLQEYVEEYRRRDGYRTIPGHTLVSATAKVSTDGDRCYVELPFRVVDLPDDMGVFRVKRSGSINAMVRVSPLFDTVFSGTDAGNLSTVENFTVEGDKVYFGNLSKENALSNVDMLLLGIPNDQTAVLNVPAGWPDRLRAVSYTHLTLPTISSV